MINRKNRLQKKFNTGFKKSVNDYPVKIVNAIDGKAENFKTFGNSEQTQYEGYNLLSENWIIGYDIGNGVFKSGHGHCEDKIAFSTSDTIYVYIKPKNEYGIKIGRLFMSCFTEDGTYITRITPSVYDTTIKDEKRYSYTFSQNSLSYIMISLYSLNTFDEDGNITQHTYNEYKDLVDICISRTQVDRYEPYVGGTASPNPDYPQEIYSCGDLVTDEEDEHFGKYKIEVENRGKNLFDKNENIVYGYHLNLDTGELEEYRSDFYQETYIPVKPSTDYYISSTILGWLRHCEYDENKNFIFGSIQNSFTTKANTRYIRLSTSNYRKDKLQLEEGSAATLYEPYRAPQIQTLYLDEPLHKIGDYADVLFYNKKNSPYYNANLNEGWNKYKIINKYQLQSSYINSIYEGTYVYRLFTYQYPAVVKTALDNKNIILTSCNYFKSITRNESDKAKSDTSNSIAFLNTTGFMINLPKDSKLVGLDAFKNFVDENEVNIFYILANPIYEAITDITQPQNGFEIKNGTNIIEVLTETKPSKIEFDYKCKEKTTNVENTVESEEE